jgi:hypothetical protein
MAAPKGHKGYKKVGDVSHKTKVTREIGEKGTEEIHEIWNLIQTFKKTDPEKYLAYMKDWAPYFFRQQPKENNLTVSQGPNLSTAELKSYSLETQRQIRDLMLAEQQKLLNEF